MMTILSYFFIVHSPSSFESGNHSGCANSSGGVVVKTPSVSTDITVSALQHPIKSITAARHDDVMYPATGKVCDCGAFVFPPARCAAFPYMELGPSLNAICVGFLLSCNFRRLAYIPRITSSHG